MKKLLLLFLAFSCLIVQAQTPDTNYFTPNGAFDTIFDNYGNPLQLKNVAVMPQESVLTSSLLQSTLLQTVGMFEIYYEAGSGMEAPNDASHIARRNVIHNVFSDASAFFSSPLKNVGNTTKIKIWIRSFDEVSSLMANPISYGTSYYNVPKNNSSTANIVDNQLWKTINSGNDAYENTSNIYYDETTKLKFYHATLAFNFKLANQWHTNLNTNAPFNKYDLYSYALRELTHALGFTSLLKENGLSKLGADYKSYSRFDTFLKNQNNQKLINNTTGCNAMQGYVFTGSSNDLHGNCNNNGNNSNNSNCGQSVQFVGTQNIKLFTPNCYSNTNSFNFSNNNCNNALATNWLMQQNFGLGNTQRFYNAAERILLNDLGYSTTITFGSTTTLNYQNYGSAAAINIIVGVNDGFNNEGGFSYNGNINENITISNFLNNDYSTNGSNLEFECLQDITHPNTSFSSTNGNATTAIAFSSDQAGLHVLSYVPFDSATGKRGNITYVYVYLRLYCGALTPDPCNYITNGDFNLHIGTPNGSNTVDEFACNWYADTNTGTPDYFLNGLSPAGVPPASITNPGSDNAYIGFSCSKELVNNQNLYQTELPFSILNSPLLPNTTYNLSFQVLKTNDIAFDGNFEMQACLVNQPTPLNPFTIPQDVTTGNYIFPAGSIFLDQNILVQNTTAWETINFTFTTGSLVDQNFLYIGPLINPQFTPANQELIFIYCYIDNVILTPVFNPQLNITSPICVTDPVLDLNSYLTGSTTGGFFSINGTPITGSDFNPSTVGLGTHTISYTIPTTIACPEIVVSGTIFVTNCVPIQSPYISQVYVGKAQDRFVEIKNADNTESITPGVYYLVLYSNGSTTPSAWTDIATGGNISPNGVKVFKGLFTFNPNYAASTATLFNGLQSFTGVNDVLIISTSNGATAFADRIDIIGDNTPNSIFYKDYTLEAYPSLVRVSCPQVTFPKTSYDEQDWVGFSLTETSINTDRKNSILGRHYSDVLTFRTSSTWDEDEILDQTPAINESFPDRSRSLLFKQNYDTNSFGSFEGCGMIIETPKIVTINPVDYAKIQTSIEVENFAQMNIEDGGSLVMARDCFYGVCGTALSSTGMSLKRNTISLSGPNDYVYWSSPLTSNASNPTAGQIFNFGSGTGPIFNMSRFYSFENQNYCDIYRKFDVAQPVAPNPDGYDDDLNDYLPFTHPFNINAQNQQLKPGRGYLTWPPTPTASDYNYQIEFKGEMNNGIVSVPVFKNNSETGKNSNLVGNPFPSAINLDKFFKVNEFIIEPIVYVWGRISDDPNATPGPYGYNYLAGNYAVYTQDFTLNDQFNGTFGGGNVLSSGQSFVVRTIKRPEDFGGVFIPAETVPSNISPATHPLQQIISAGNLIFRNVMRTTAPNTTFSRLANAVSNTTNETQSDKLWVNLTDTNNFSAQLGVGFKATGNANYVQGEDFTTISGRKYDFYTQSTPEDLIIDIQDSFSIEKIIPLGITNISDNSNQSFSISIPKKSGVFNTQEVYLYDSLFDVFHNITNSSYSFTTNSYLTENRFSLCFSQNNSNLARNSVENNLVVSIENDTLHVISKEKLIKKVEVFDIYTANTSGVKIVEIKDVNAKESLLPIAPKFKLLTVKIQLEDGTIINKKIMK